MAGRCRVCTSNDEAALVEHVAAALWESRRHGTLDDRPWPEAFPYWQRVYRELAETAIESLQVEHAAHS